MKITEDVETVLTLEEGCAILRAELPAELRSCLGDGCDCARCDGSLGTCDRCGGTFDRSADLFWAGRELCCDGCVTDAEYEAL